jgi:hypothetical protein
MRLLHAAFAVIIVVAMPRGAAALERSLPTPPATIGVAVDYDSSVSAQVRRRASRTNRAVIGALRSLGYRTVRVNRMCDDLDAGARHAGVRYYVSIVIPGREAAAERLEFHEVGNVKVLRTVTIPAGRSTASAVARLMDRRSWALARAPRGTC